MDNSSSNPEVKQDIPYIHILRIMACVMVVCLHSLPQMPELPRAHSLFRLAVILVTRPCVPLFLMITGFLLLRNQTTDISLAPFWRKRIPRVFFPLIIWGVVYALLPSAIHPVEIGDLVYAVVMTPFEYPQEIGGILWYLFTLIGIYLFLPFLSSRLFTNRMYQRIFICLWILSSVVAYCQFLDENILSGNPWAAPFDVLIYFSGLLGYLILGLYISTCSFQLKSRPLVVSCILIFAISAVAIVPLSKLIESDWPKSFFSVPSIAMSACIYLIISKLYRGGYFRQSDLSLSSVSAYISATWLSIPCSPGGSMTFQLLR